jgi:type IV secretion system protein VirD4
MKAAPKSLLGATLALSLFLAYLAHRFVSLYLTLIGNNPLTKISLALNDFLPSLTAAPLAFTFTTPALIAALVTLAIVWLIYFYHFFLPKNYLHGQEYGTARWGRPQDIAPFINTAHPDENIILSATERLSLSPAKHFKYSRNHNVLVIGGSGSGKTHSHLKPNLMQLSGSYVVTDPKGTVLSDVGYLFQTHGYRLQTFNTVDFSKSACYNPLAYVKSEKDILKLAHTLIINTKGEGKNGDDFWLKAEQLWLSAAIGYLFYHAPPSDRTLPSLIDLLEISNASGNDPHSQSPLDLMFADLATQDPDCFPVRQYKKFKLAAGDTLKSILISVAARLSPFDIAELRHLLQKDELHLDQLGTQKTALFVIMSDTDNTYSFINAILFYQLFDFLTDQADATPAGRLPVPVRFLLDEFANIGLLPNFEKTIATIRSRGMSASIILQSLAQLSALYQKKSEIIVDCCDTVLFLGGKSVKTTKDLAEMIGKTTINYQSSSRSHGSEQNGSHSLNEQITARNLINPAEIAAMSRDECLVLISGLPPFKSKKYHPATHPRWSYLADARPELKYHFPPTASIPTSTAFA